MYSVSQYSAVEKTDDTAGRGHVSVTRTLYDVMHVYWNTLNLMFPSRIQKGSREREVAKWVVNQGSFVWHVTSCSWASIPSSKRSLTRFCHWPQNNHDLGHVCARVCLSVLCVCSLCENLATFPRCYIPLATKHAGIGYKPSNRLFMYRE